MQFDRDWELPSLAVDGLRQVSTVQDAFDAVNWTGPCHDDGRRRHVGFHLTIAAGKIARVEERLDHGVQDEDLVREVAADLLVYALQLARSCDAELSVLYASRLRQIHTDRQDQLLLSYQE